MWREASSKGMWLLAKNCPVQVPKRQEKGYVTPHAVAALETLPKPFMNQTLHEEEIRLVQAPPYEQA